MNTTTAHKKFIFNEKIDQDFLYSMYEDDYTYIQEVFTTTLSSFDEDVMALQFAFESEDIQWLRKAAHKLKPVLGFTGLLKHQEEVNKFEEECYMATSFDSIIDSYYNLLKVIREGKQLIEEEHSRLTVFTRSVI